MVAPVSATPLGEGVEDMYRGSAQSTSLVPSQGLADGVFLALIGIAQPHRAGNKLEFLRNLSTTLSVLSGPAWHSLEEKAMRPVFTVLCLVSITSCALAATPSSGTLSAPASGQTSAVNWAGGPYTAVTGDPSLCTGATCDRYTLQVSVPSTFYSSNPGYVVQVGLNWSSNTNDFDLYISDSSGNTVCSSGQGMTNFELADCGQLPSGTYTIQVVTFAAVAATYSGNASLGPEPANAVGKARYKSGNFTWTSPILLPGPDDALFGTQDIEPRVRADSIGNIYAAGIQGIPAGTDAWKSMDGGKTWT